MRVESPEEGYRIALARIADCKRSQSPVLDLGGLRLTALPEEVLELGWLTTLYLGEDVQARERALLGDFFEPIPCNAISALPQAFASALPQLTVLDLNGNTIGPEGARALEGLTNLNSLNLSHNNIGDAGAQALKGLTNLTLLDLDWNQIGPEGAQALKGLTNLTSLYLGWNQIGLEGAQALKGLTNLTELNLDNNEIGDEGAQALEGLTALTWLDLSDNEITDALPLSLTALEQVELSNNQLAGNWRAFFELPSLCKVILSDATLEGVPDEVLSRGFGDNCLPRLRAHYADLDQGGAPMRDVKLMLLGNGRVGKTQIRNRLCGAEFEAESISTHGVRLSVQELDMEDDAPAVLKIWDFGGQDIYLGTHSLFLKSRAILLLAWALGKESGAHDYRGVRSQNFPLEYWLHYAATMAGKASPVITLRTQADKDQRGKIAAAMAEQARALLAQFAYHDSVARYSAATGRGHDELLDCLRDAVAHIRAAQGSVIVGLGRLQVIEEMERRRRAAQEIDERNLRAKADDQALEPVPQDYRWITQKAFREICEAIGNVSSPDLLLDYLHQIGVVFFDENLFDARVVIDQQWALDAIYAVFDRENGLYTQLSENSSGRFSRGFLTDALWRRMGHDDSAAALFMSMMRSCDICFSLEGSERENDADATHVAPELLPEKAALPGEPDQIRWDQPHETARFCFDFLSPSLMRSIMAEIGGMAGRKALYWRGGLSFKEAETGAYATIAEHREASEYGGEIRIATQSGDARALLRRLIKLVEKRVRRLGLTASAVEKPDAPSRDEAERDAPPIQAAPLDKAPPNAAYVSYAWGSLLDDATEEEHRREAQVDALIAKATADGRAIIRDKDKLTYGDRISEFMDQLAEGQHIYVVLSDKYLHSPFCMYELYKIWDNCDRDEDRFLKKVTIISLPDADLRQETRFKLTDYWQNRYRSTQMLGRENWELHSDIDKKSVLFMRSIAEKIGAILALICDSVHARDVSELPELMGIESR